MPLCVPSLFESPSSQARPKLKGRDSRQQEITWAWEGITRVAPTQWRSREARDLGCEGTARRAWGGQRGTSWRNGGWHKATPYPRPLPLPCCPPSPSLSHPAQWCGSSFIFRRHVALCDMPSYSQTKPRHLAASILCSRTSRTIRARTNQRP